MSYGTEKYGTFETCVTTNDGAARRNVTRTVCDVGNHATSRC